uniref:Uncharacterized protein n=2 Tax=Oryza brachyantha TaxID=4533 RepID=J3MPN6_ORYBR
MHSSRHELEQALRIIHPRWVISTTPPSMALELSYVKKHCLASRLRADDPLWKLLRLADGNPTVSSGSPQPVAAVEIIIKKSEEEEVTYSADGSFGDDRLRMQDKEPTLEDFEINVELPVTLFGMARFGLPHEPELWKDEGESVQVIEEDELQVQVESSATECEQRKDGKSDMPAEAIDSVEVLPEEQNSAIESEQSKDCEPKDGIKAIDLTEVEVNEQTSCTESVLWKKHGGNECVSATERGDLDAQEQKFTARYQLWKVRKPKGMESVESIVQGENRAETIDQVLEVDPLASSQERNKERTKKDTVPQETDHENSEVTDNASSDSNAIGSSKGLNANLRKLYRSMNVPVPRPLPSLVELMATSKRPRVSPAVQL